MEPAARIGDVASVVAEVLRERILAGHIEAGTQLRQEAIAAEQGVSHIPVREALRTLEAEGLVTIIPRRGAFVAELSAADAAEISLMRVALETLALRQAIGRAGPADLAAAEAAIARGDATADIAEWSRANWAFHGALYRPCGLPRLLATIDTLWRNVDRYLRVVWRTQPYQERSQAEHRAILAAYRAGDADTAAVLLTRHVDAAMAALVHYLERPAGRR